MTNEAKTALNKFFDKFGSRVKKSSQLFAVGAIAAYAGSTDALNKVSDSLFHLPGSEQIAEITSSVKSKFDAPTRNFDELARTVPYFEELQRIQQDLVRRSIAVERFKVDIESVSSAIDDYIDNPTPEKMDNISQAIISFNRNRFEDNWAVSEDSPELTAEIRMN